MRGRLLNWPAVARLLGYIAVAVAIMATAIHVARHGYPTVSSGQTKRRVQSDELLRELARCQSLGGTAKGDRDCEAAWAENRRRFFGDGGTSVRPAAAAGAPAKAESGSQP
jgi:conjugative transfer region protein TrbK